MTEAAAPAFDLIGQGWSLAPDTFLEPLLGSPCYRLAVEEHADWQSLESAIGRGGEVFVDVKVPATATSIVGRLERTGFELVDTNVRFTLPDVFDTGLSRRPEVLIRASTPGDEPSVLSIAAEMGNSRFHLDPRIDPGLASRIKVEWVANFFRGTRGDRLLVADIGGKASGFLLAIDNSTAVIDLIAVSSDKRRQGLAREMVLELRNAPPRRRAITVGTQVSNTASLRFYESLGFRVSAAFYVLHSHGRPG